MSVKSKERDFTKLESYIGLSPKKALATLKSCGHMLALGEKSDNLSLEIVRTLEGEHGEEAALAGLAAVLFLRKYGAVITALEGIKMYKEIAKEKPGSLSERIRHMENMFYFASRGIRKDISWPWKLPCPTLNHKAGLANVMLGLALREMALNHTTTCDLIAATGIATFLDEGKENMRKKMEKSKSA